MKNIASIAALAAFVGNAASTPLLSSRNNGGSSLADLAKSAGKKYFGTEISSYYWSSEKFSKTYRSQFNQITPENEMKWEVINPSKGVYNWTGSDLIAAVVKETGSLFRGHNFVWHQQTPEYVTNITDADELKATLKEHINAVMGRYADQFYGFDVINEPLEENGTLRQSVWLDVLGPTYLETALEYAHAAAPNVKLYINDYNIEGINNKSTALYEMAKDWVARGVPLHGIGLESHFIGGEVPTDITANMQRFADLGLELAITELDVRVPIANDGTANSTWLEIQAQDYANVTQSCLNVDKCVGITVWGFDDYRSWIPAVFAGTGAACLYDLNIEPKPALAAVQKQLSQ